MRSRLLAATLLACAACGSGAPEPSSCGAGSLGQGPDPATGAVLRTYSTEYDTATYRVVCEALDANESRWKLSCAYGTFTDRLSTAGGEITSTSESEDCPQSLDAFNDLCGFGVLRRDPGFGG